MSDEQKKVWLIVRESVLVSRRVVGAYLSEDAARISASRMIGEVDASGGQILIGLESYELKE